MDEVVSHGMKFSLGKNYLSNLNCYYLDYSSLYNYSSFERPITLILDNFDYLLEAEKYEEESSLKTKFQDALIVLNKINAPIEIILLVKSRIKMIEDISKKEKL